MKSELTGHSTVELHGRNDSVSPKSQMKRDNGERKCFMLTAHPDEKDYYELVERQEIGLKSLARTDWVRSTVNREDTAATVLMRFYDGKLFSTTGWWNGANCLTALLDYFKFTGSRRYRYVIDEIYERNKEEQFGNFTNDYIDDTLWWGLAWVRAYELTENQKYLDAAKHTCDYSYRYKDWEDGGIWWRTKKDYKNAVTNELFIKLAASLHNNIPGDTKYLNQAVEVWNWFKTSGMINQEDLINDGLTSDGKNNGEVTWTYNQGIILGALVELCKAENDRNYLAEAWNIADAVLNSKSLNPNGILKEFGCGKEDDNKDSASFKGAFVRNLGELNRMLKSRPYSDWLRNQVESNWSKNRNSLNQFGMSWEGPFDKADAARQHSALDTFVAIL